LKSKNQKYLIWIALPLWLLAFGCAQIRGLDGGAVDADPPQLVSVYPENLSTRFREKTIVLTFDEYVQINNIAQELVVSPPLNRPVKVEIKRKTVYLTIEEELRPNATYTFNFGNAIVDFREGNKADLNYVVSTGDVIDSLAVAGSVRDAWTGAPSEGTRVMLYPDTSTSNVLRGVPLYMTKSRKDGSFKLSYLAPGKYHLVLVTETTENYSLDDNELMAFSDSLVQPQVDDSLLTMRRFYLSHSMPRNQSITNYQVDSVGKLSMVRSFRFAPLVAIPERESLSQISVTDEFSDSTWLWLLGPAGDTEEGVILSLRDSVLDTLYVPYFESYRIKPIKGKLSSSARVSPKSLIRVKFPIPIDSLDATRILLFHSDSIPVMVSPSISSNLPNEISVDHSPLIPASYRLLLLPGAVRSIHGASNDTVDLKFGVPLPSDFGAIKLSVSGIGSDYALFLELREAKGRLLWLGVVDSPGVWKMGELLPGEYEVRVWEDRIGNGLWDEADFENQVQPERVWVFNQKLNIRANWDIDLKWDLSQPD